MDPINININVQVGLTEDTGRTLKELILRERAGAPSAAAEKAAERETAAKESNTPAGTKKAPNRTEMAEKRPETTERRPETAGIGTDAKENDAKEPETITDVALREAVKLAKNRTDVKTVRALFNEFGIGASSECPNDKRPELLRRLAVLEKGGQDNA
jgi:hypothetical protein